MHPCWRVTTKHELTADVLQQGWVFLVGSLCHNNYYYGLFIFQISFKLFTASTLLVGRQEGSHEIQLQ